MDNRQKDLFIRAQELIQEALAKINEASLILSALSYEESDLLNKTADLVKSMTDEEKESKKK